MSQALDMIRMCYEAGVTRTGPTVWKGRMHDAIRTAILCGLQFEPDDIWTLCSWRNQAWQYADGFEPHYASATGMTHRSHVRNQSAIVALEKYLGRPVYNYAGGRLYVWRWLYLTADLPCPSGTWDPGWCKVTSFHDPEYAIFTSGSRRVKMTPVDVWALEKARKERG